MGKNKHKNKKSFIRRLIKKKSIKYVFGFICAIIPCVCSMQQCSYNQYEKQIEEEKNNFEVTKSIIEITNVKRSFPSNIYNIIISNVVREHSMSLCYSELYNLEEKYSQKFDLYRGDNIIETNDIYFHMSKIIGMVYYFLKEIDIDSLQKEDSYLSSVQKIKVVHLIDVVNNMQLGYHITKNTPIDELRVSDYKEMISIIKGYIFGHYQNDFSEESIFNDMQINNIVHIVSCFNISLSKEIGRQLIEYNKSIGKCEEYEKSFSQKK